MFKENQLLKDVCTLKVGGPARYFFTAYSEDDLKAAFQRALKDKIPVFVLGKGSNCLFDDRGFDGLVIQNKWSQASIDDTRVWASAGYSFAYLGIKTAKLTLTGLEFASGVPATVGGAVYMNAGANGQDVSKVFKECRILNLDGEFQTLDKSEVIFGYRYTSLQQKPFLICDATFELERDILAAQTQKKILNTRLASQPYDENSAGCFFRNPEGASAGQLIDAAGLKGFSIGDAEVSLKHANFIINRGQATSKDMHELITHVQKRIKETSGIDLKLEVRSVPYRPEVYVSS